MIKINCDTVIFRFCESIRIYKPECTALFSIRCDDDIIIKMYFLCASFSSQCSLAFSYSQKMRLSVYYLPPATGSCVVLWLIFDCFRTIVVSAVGWGGGRGKKGSYGFCRRRDLHILLALCGRRDVDVHRRGRCVADDDAAVEVTFFSLAAAAATGRFCAFPRPARRRRPARERSALSRHAGATE